IPYLLFVALCAIPVFYLEAALGQFGSLSPLAMWKISPLFKGIGYSMVAVGFVANIYYNVIVAWVVYFLFASFTWTLPWSTCDNSWNTPQCSSIQVNTTSNKTVDYLLKTFTAYTIKQANFSVNVANGSALVNTTQRRVSPSEEYWRYISIYVFFKNTFISINNTEIRST
ncbi:unnamed protein product, partial [Owenia fusiformis]